MLETKWLVERLPKEFLADQNSVLEGIRILLSHELISVKYQDETEICVRPLPKGRTETEYRQDRQAEKQRTQKTLMLSAFLGGLVSGAVTSILTAIVMRVFGVS